MTTTKQQQQQQQQQHVWPDPRGRWKDEAKTALEEIIRRGRGHVDIANSSANNLGSSPSSTSTPSSSSSDLLPPLEYGSSDFNFSKPASSRAGPNARSASVAAFLVHLSKHLSTVSELSSTTSAPSVSSGQMKGWLDEAFLLFLADVIDAACGPGGAAALRVKYPPAAGGSSSSGEAAAAAADAWLDSVERAGGNRIISVPTAAGVSSGAVAVLNNNSASAAAAAGGGTQQQITVRRPESISVIVIPGPTANAPPIVIDRCGPTAGQPPLSGSRRGRGTAAAAAAAGDDPSGAAAEVAVGLHRDTVAMRECDNVALKALLCRRPLLHVLPCCVLWLVFATLEKLLANYDAMRLGGQDHSRMPPGVPACVAAGLSAGEQGRTWDWVFGRASVAMQLLWGGRDQGFARVS